MAVLITGGCGHIGSWLAYLFARRGKNVYIYDRNTRVPECLNEARIKVHFIKGNIMDFSHLNKVFGKYNNSIEGIVYTASIMGEFVEKNPHKNTRLNVEGTLNLLEMARRFKIRRVLYVSTGAVYGKTAGLVSEDDCPCAVDLYGATKLASEYLGIQYADTFGLDFLAGRLYFVY